MLDYVLKNGKVVDGTGNPWFYGGVGIKDGLITHVGKIEIEAKEVIDVKGQIIAPGFIDGHSHSDLQVIDSPYEVAKLQQGVTTEVVGNCGLSPAPLTMENSGLLKAYIEPIIGNTSWEWPWQTVGDYISFLDRVNLSHNLSTFVAHGSLRIAVMGFANRPATKKEMEKMKILLEEGMKAGAIGLSIGLLYAPGRYAEKEELVDLCKVLAKYQGVLSTHIRGEGNNLISSVSEVISIAEKSNISLHISHLKAAGKRNWGNTERVIALMEDARSRGMDVTCDVYPYEAGSTSLTTLLPPWSLEGGLLKCIGRISDKNDREKMKKEMSVEQDDWDNLIVSTGWHSVVISAVRNNKQLEGLSVGEISENTGKNPIDVALDLLLEEEGKVSVIYFHMSRSDVKRVIEWDYSLVISDSLGCHTRKPHPRTYGTFPRLFAKYVRDEKALSLEQAVRKVTSFPAKRFSLGKRGLIVPGYFADLTIFNYTNIKDTATYQHPRKHPQGISIVFVNGRKTIINKKHLSQFAGDVLSATETVCSCINF